MTVRINAKAFGVAGVIVLLLVVAVIGAIGYYVVLSKHAGRPNASRKSQVAAPSTAPDAHLTKAPSDPTAAQWALAISNSKSFSIRIPDGWEIYDDPSMDAMSALGPEVITYKPGTKAVIRHQAIPGKDGIMDSFVVFSSKSSTNMSDPDATVTDYGPVDGVMGKKSTKIYAAGEPLGYDKAVGGERMYTYEFNHGNRYYEVEYSVSDPANDHIAIAEQAIQTLRFQ